VNAVAHQQTASVSGAAATGKKAPLLKTIPPRADTVMKRQQTMTRVFISYSQDSQEHNIQVLRLADRLRREGIDCHLDQYETFPPEGWPRWMSDQIEQADYVLVLCTETYARRALGHDSPDRGLGANWEGQLITQSIYDRAGRNTKFVPVILRASDVSHIPQFVSSATHFDVSEESGYEALYRLLTSQPAVARPDLGAIRKFEIARTSIEMGIDKVGGETTFLDVETAVVIWRLPRGFLLLEALQDEQSVSWATLAHSYDYQGEWKQSTHYHETYDWWDKPSGIENQYRKLQVPQGDWNFARPAIQFLMNVRNRRFAIPLDGKIAGSPAERYLDGKLATIHPPGPISLPTLPDEYRVLAVVGELRDLAAEAWEILMAPVLSARPSVGMDDLPGSVAPAKSGKS
jgi:hypothetical protein